jgi:hypothetical protein
VTRIIINEFACFLFWRSKNGHASLNHRCSYLGGLDIKNNFRRVAVIGSNNLKLVG